MKKTQSRLRNSISLEKFNLAWKFPSWPSEFPTEKGLWWVTCLKCSISFEKCQSQREFLIFFSIFGPLGLFYCVWGSQDTQMLGNNGTKSVIATPFCAPQMLVKPRTWEQCPRMLADKAQEKRQIDPILCMYWTPHAPESTTSSMSFGFGAGTVPVNWFPLMTSVVIFLNVITWGEKRYRKKLCDKDFAERSGELTGAICLKTLVLLGSDAVIPSNRSENSLFLFVRILGFVSSFWLLNEHVGSCGARRVASQLHHPALRLWGYGFKNFHTFEEKQTRSELDGHNCLKSRIKVHLVGP